MVFRITVDALYFDLRQRLSWDCLKHNLSKFLKCMHDTFPLLHFRKPNYILLHIITVT